MPEYDKDALTEEWLDFKKRMDMDRSFGTFLREWALCDFDCLPLEMKIIVWGMITLPLSKRGENECQEGCLHYAAA